MRVRITEKGVHDEEGNKVPVGKELEIDLRVLPGFLVGKCQIIDQAEDEDLEEEDENDEERTQITNPAEGAVKSRKNRNKRKGN